MSLSISHLGCSSGAIFAGEIASFLTAILMYGSASFKNSSGDLALIYSALKYLSFSISNMAGDLDIPSSSKASVSSVNVKNSFSASSPLGDQPKSAT